MSMETPYGFLKPTSIDEQVVGGVPFQ
jgi:hypothetical protein